MQWNDSHLSLIDVNVPEFDIDIVCKFNIFKIFPIEVIYIEVLKEFYVKKNIIVTKNYSLDNSN